MQCNYMQYGHRIKYVRSLKWPVCDSDWKRVCVCVRVCSRVRSNIGLVNVREMNSFVRGTNEYEQ